jgi:excisionase family DNA binding protein
METRIPANNPISFVKRERMLINVNEAAQMLNLSKSYIYREAHAGNIPHAKIGSRILFRIVDLDAWIDSQKPKEQETRCA